MLTTWKYSGTIEAMKQTNYIIVLMKGAEHMEQYKGIQAKWEFSNKEKAFIDYCIKNNYEITECKQYVSKTKWKFKINNSIVDTWETLEDESKFDEKQVDNYVKIKIELEDMRNKMN